MSTFLAALPTLAATVLLLAVLAARFREIRRERRDAEAARVKRDGEATRARLDAAVARHPSRRAVRQSARVLKVPGRYPDGEPLSEEELRKYLGLMFRSAAGRGNQARETSADEGAE